MPEALKGWHLDHRIPVALILALIVQTAGMVWWASGITAQVSDHERRLAVTERLAETKARDDRDLSERLVRLESGMGEIGRAIDRLTLQLERSGRVSDE